jgi:hypothetical protein
MIMTITCCPRCGGTSGLAQNISFIQEEDENWDGTQRYGGDILSAYTSKIVTCIDCGAKFRYSTILKERGIKDE